MSQSTALKFAKSQVYLEITKNILFLLQKFLDSSKLKRHFLIHTGERDFVCPHEGCGKVINRSIALAY